jgi:hypothetical protein
MNSSASSLKHCQGGIRLVTSVGAGAVAKVRELAPGLPRRVVAARDAHVRAFPGVVVRWAPVLLAPRAGLWFALRPRLGSRLLPDPACRWRQLPLPPGVCCTASSGPCNTLHSRVLAAGACCSRGASWQRHRGVGCRRWVVGSKGLLLGTGHGSRHHCGRWRCAPRAGQGRP